MYEKILVTLDGSAAAENVLPYVEEIAGKFGSQVILVSVSEFNICDLEHLYQSYLGKTIEQLERDIKTYPGIKEVHVLSEVLAGDPAKEILRYADETGVDLIALTSRGSSGEGPWLLGNISAKILRATRHPVMLIRRPASEEALTQKKLIKRILAPLDGSELGKSALSSAEMLARTLGAEIVLYQVVMPLEIHSIYPPPPYIPPDQTLVTESPPSQSKSGETYSIYATPAPLPTRDFRRINEMAMTYLESVGKPLKENDVKVSIAIGFGYPADEIIDYAKRNNVDLIVVSSHGQSGLRRWVWGGVTGKLVHAGDTPIMVVRAGKVPS